METMLALLPDVDDDEMSFLMTFSSVERRPRLSTLADL
jgi:hypothetical protein